MDFSVIVPFFNAKKTLGACLDSLQNQSLPAERYELIFVDDGSTDGSPEIIEESPRCRLIRQTRRGGSYQARNRGLQIAAGKILAFTDADCEVSRRWLEQIGRTIQTGRANVVLGARFFPKNSSFLLRAVEHYENEKTAYTLTQKSPAFAYAHTNNMAFKRMLYDRVGGFQPWHRGADIEFLQRCLAQSPSLRVRYDKSVRITHHEISTLGIWLKKMALYGYSCQRLSAFCTYQRLHVTDNLKIFARACKRHKISGFSALVAFFVLLLGAWKFRTGGWRAQIEQWTKRNGQNPAEVRDDA